jgi:hypothetical protein
MLFPRARDVALSPETAPVNSPAPANGIVGASAVLRLLDDATDRKLVDGAHSRPDSKPVALLRDAQHRLLDSFIGHPLGQAAGFFGSLVPILGVVDVWCCGHQRILSRTKRTPQEASLEEEAALLPGGHHVRASYDMLIGCQSVDLNQNREADYMTQK